MMVAVVYNSSNNKRQRIETHSRPDEVADEYRRRASERAKHAAAWRRLRAEHLAKLPDAAAKLDARLSGVLPQGWDQGLPSFTPKDSASATRKLGGAVLEKVC
jgi:transketolase